MSDHTKIEWADATVNAVNGCSVVSPGCSNCYAMRLAGTRMKNHPTRAGLTNNSKAGPVWNGEVRLHEPALLQPLRWKRPRRIFWNAHGDLFHPSVPDAWIDRVFAVCALTPQHTHMILTKRSARMREYFSVRQRPTSEALYDLLHGAMMSIVEKTMQRAIDAAYPLSNVWLGVSVEDQTRADERIPDLLATPGAKRFISAEPLLGPVDIQAAGGDPAERYFDPHHGSASIGWVIVGGESGPSARPMHPDWARSLRDQCAEACVPFHFKQWGEHIAHPAPGATWADGSPVPADLSPVTFERVGKKCAGRLLDGIEHNGVPA